MRSTPVDNGVGLIVTVALPVKPDDGRVVLPEPTLVVPLARVTRRTAPAQAVSMPETVTLVICPEVSIVAANAKPLPSHEPTDAVPPPSGRGVVGMAAADATPAPTRTPIRAVAVKSRASTATRAYRAEEFA
jgi:hypothetical protein